MHGLIFETSVCYWQNQPGFYFQSYSRNTHDHNMCRRPVERTDNIHSHVHSLVSPRCKFITSTTIFGNTCFFHILRLPAELSFSQYRSLLFATEHNLMGCDAAKPNMDKNYLRIPSNRSRSAESTTEATMLTHSNDCPTLQHVFPPISFCCLLS